MYELLSPLIAVVSGIIVALFSVHYKDYRDREIMKKELYRALGIETKRNIELIRAIVDFDSSYSKITPEYRKKAILVPYHTDVWQSIINRGLLYVFKDKDVTESLVEVCNSIHEINGLIVGQEYKEQVIVSLAYSTKASDVIQGIYLPSAISNKSQALRNKMKELRKKLNLNHLSTLNSF